MDTSDVERERTWSERIVQLEHQIERLTRIAERQRDRVDLILGSEPEVAEKYPEARYAR